MEYDRTECVFCAFLDSESWFYCVCFPQGEVGPERAAAPDRIRLRMSGRTKVAARMDPPPREGEQIAWDGPEKRAFKGDLQLQARATPPHHGTTIHLIQ